MTITRATIGPENATQVNPAPSPPKTATAARATSKYGAYFHAFASASLRQSSGTGTSGMIGHSGARVPRPSPAATSAEGAHVSAYTSTASCMTPAASAPDSTRIDEKNRSWSPDHDAAMSGR